MVFIAFCLRKGWSIKDFNDRSYRSLQMDINMYHENEELFKADNDFENYPSKLVDSEEDDLDNFNLDIQQDLVESGEKYLKMYTKKKNKHKNAKQKKRSEIARLLKEIEDLVGMMSSDAMAANMHWLDLNDNETEMTDEKIRVKIENELEAAAERENRENELYEQKKEEMLNEASERDTALYDKAKNALANGLTDLKKDLNQGEDEGNGED